MKRFIYAFIYASAFLISSASTNAAAQTATIEQYTVEAQALAAQPQISVAFAVIERESILREWSAITKVDVP